MLERDIDQLLRIGELRRRDRIDIAQHLAGDPVLTISAVKIATEHAEGQGIRAGQDVEEGLFLNRIARDASHVAMRDQQRPIVIEADSTDPIATGLNEAAMPASKALDRPVGLVL